MPGFFVMAPVLITFFNYKMVILVFYIYIMKIKDDFHHLIDAIEDEQLLKGYYELIQRINSNQSGRLWNNLSEKEKKELLIAYEESFDNSNLLSHEQVKLQHERWLKQ